MIAYPAIDLKTGRAVRLDQGRADAETRYFEDPGEPARLFQAAGSIWVHVVDLDGAFTGDQGNRAAVEAILKTGLKVELGGGLRSVEAVGRALEAGVARAVVGTRACQEPEFADELVKTFGADKIAVGIDARDGKVAVSGWTEVTSNDAVDLARQLAGLGVQTIIYTDISRDGMLLGPNFDSLEAMLKSVDLQVVASGGVATLEDVQRLRKLQARYRHLDGVIVGKALYEKRFTIEQFLGACDGEG